MGDKSLTDLLLARKDVMAELSEDEVRKLTDPQSYLGLSAAMVNRVLQHAG
jgi:adenylosuccinate lyase